MEFQNEQVNIVINDKTFVLGYLRCLIHLDLIRLIIRSNENQPRRLDTLKIIHRYHSNEKKKRREFLRIPSIKISIPLECAV